MNRKDRKGGAKMEVLTQEAQRVEREVGAGAQGMNHCSLVAGGKRLMAALPAPTTYGLGCQQGLRRRTRTGYRSFFC